MSSELVYNVEKLDILLFDLPLIAQLENLRVENIHSLVEWHVSHRKRQCVTESRLHFERFQAKQVGQVQA